MRKILDKIKEYGIKVIFSEMDDDGICLPELKTIFIRQNLCEQDMKEVLLHELKHILSHTEYIALYNIPCFHNRMEVEADEFVLNYLIEESDGQFNYSNVVEQYGIYMGWDTKFYHHI